MHVNQKHRMNASVSIVCYKSKTLSNGESPLMLQVSKSGKRKYQSLGISIKPHYWDFTRNKPKPNCPNKEYIQKIILDKQTELQLGKRQYIQLNKDIFMFSYLCGGINFTDIANLTKANIIEGKRLHYIRQKTGKLIKIGLSEEAMKIIERYATESKGYLFPILNANLHKTPLQKQNRIHKILGKVNINLKLIAAQLGVEGNLTTYVARHSFASVLKKSGVNIALISEALGHSDIATTQIYLDSFDNEQIDAAMKNLL